MRAGEAEVIYQPYLSDGTWRGFADFLERQPDGTYEAVDTKLARSAKPAHVLQLCFYSEQLGRIQGQLPEYFHVELGTGERETFRLADHMAYFRRARERFLGALETEPETYPWPCDHCGLCDFRNLCKQRLRDDDNLVLVAGLRRSQAEDLVEHGIPTLAALGTKPPGLEVDGMRSETLAGIRHQAELQLHFRETGEHRVDHLPDEEGRGFRLLPEPDFGDVWLDLEGHPFYEPARGLEYLFGWCYRDEDGSVRYEAAWARDRDGECEIFERFVDWMVERRRRYPGAHVYHYASYERSALRRLMGEHGTREAEVDDFLRHDVLVDLYRVVKQALRASVESYSIKAIEALYGFVRTAEVSGGDESTVLFEKWLESATTPSCAASRRTTRRTAARPSRSTSGCCTAVRRVFRGARPSSPRSPRRRCRTSVRCFATSCSPVRRRRATRPGSSRSSSTTTAARRSRSGGSGSSTSHSTRRS